MKRSQRKLWILALGLLAVCSPAAAQSLLETSIEPPTVAIDAFYDGAAVTVNGELPADCEAVVRVMGARGDLHLKKKGKVGGLLWMNLDTITIQNIPAVFIIHTAKDFAEVASPSEASNEARKLGLAYLEKETRIFPETADHSTLFKEFMKLKQSEGLYSTNQGMLRYPKTSGSQKSFEVKIPISARFPAGAYQVEVYAVRSGAVVAQASRPLAVQLVGLPAFLAAFAFSNGALYGVFAVVVALVAGLIIGVVFSGSKGGSH